MAYQSIHAGTTIDDAITNMLSLLSIILNTVYPVGSLYTSFNSTSPANIIGGTWVLILDCFLMAAGSSYAIGTSGGSATHTHTSAAHTHTTAGHTLTINEMPKHTHNGLYWLNPDVAGWEVTLNTGTYGYNLKWTGAGGSTTGGAGRNENSMRVGLTGGNASHSHGNTGSTTPGATGVSSSLPPYKTIYMWQRTG